MQPIVVRDPAVDWTDPTCPVARALDLVGDRWSLLIVRDAMDGATAFGDFRARTGISRNILSDRLSRLVDLGILNRVTAPSGRRQHYELTEAGRQLFSVVVALRQWGEGHAFAPHEDRSILVDERGAAVPALQLRSQAGEVLDSRSTRVKRPRPA